MVRLVEFEEPSASLVRSNHLRKGIGPVTA